MADLTGMMQAAAGNAGGANAYIEDVFSTYLWAGNSSSQSIDIGFDLTALTAMTWFKDRTNVDGAGIVNTVQGNTKRTVSYATDAASDASSYFEFNSTGYNFPSSTINTTGSNYVGWTFLAAPKFFDCVTYTGTGSARTVSHNLGSVPGCIMVKRTDTTGAWQVYHRANTANPETDYLVLNTTAATADSNTRWNDTLPTDSVFSLGTDATVNASGGTYVAYLFAHDAGGFGDDSSENVITCGSWTGASQTVNLGYEPQFLLWKRSDSTGDWNINDTMRGLRARPDFLALELKANSSAAETEDSSVAINATGFTSDGNTGTYIYIAIRRGPMKTPTAGTEVFGLNARSGTGATATVTGSGGVSDAVLVKNRGSAVASLFAARLTGTNYLVTSTTAAQVAAGTTILQASPWDVMDGVKVGTTSTITNASGNTFINYLFDRAPGFMDVVCYTGTGSAKTEAHNLGVVPELMIIKNRSEADAWAVYAGDNTDYLVLNTTAATADDNTYWNDTSPTSTVFSVGTVHNTNASAENYVAYLFASLAGVSKVGTYTGNGSSVTVTTGFQPRFILVKRTDSTGNWIVGDSARGLVAGDDPFLLLNSDAAETTNQDWVDVSATGFTINETAANANVNTGTYLYLAIS